MRLKALGNVGIGSFLQTNLNFYRIHILVFTFTPLVFSGIFYASNGRYKVSYVDALFNCVSAMTVCGLTTVDLSGLTPWQQVILFIQMCLGSPVLVSWVIVYTRKYCFAKKFKYIIHTSHKSAVPVPHAVKGKGWRKRFVAFFTPTNRKVVDGKGVPRAANRPGIAQRLTTDMVHRLDTTPKLVNPSGNILETHLLSSQTQGSDRPDAHVERDHDLLVMETATFHAGEAVPHFQSMPQTSSRDDGILFTQARERFERHLSDPGVPLRPFSLKTDIHRSGTAEAVTRSRTSRKIGQRTQTVDFAPLSVPRRRRRNRPSLSENIFEGTSSGSACLSSRKLKQRPSDLQQPPPATTTVHHAAQAPERTMSFKYQGFGGFPMPLEILRRLFNRFFPTLDRKLTRTLTMPGITSLAPGRTGAPTGAKVVPYISFDAIVGRNSTFHHLTSEQRDELGGIEYRALKALLWIVGAYHIGIHLICFVVIAPYISQPRWASDFVPPQELKPVNPVWFSAFQVVSAYTNSGMSLVDQSMIPFRTAYLMIVAMIFLILAGNTCFPIFLRFLIWIITKFVPHQSLTNETLRFLLDHPRRCFIYLFPPHQTWFLLSMVILLNVTDWFFFLVLDIGNAALAQISPGIRVIIGFLQASAVRAAGFSTVPISALAPAVKVLYVITMYISICNVRSTNVYEERSLGIFEDEDEDDEGQLDLNGSRVTVWGKYLALHARKQLAFDMWWLGLALFLICIIEQGTLVNPDNAIWLNIFNILFEIVSAYGSVGLSTGLPFANYSLSGAFRPLSKLIICLVMIRGRHRGLPVAIDRAVLLPSELKQSGDSIHVGNSGHSSELAAHSASRYPISHGASPCTVVKPREDGERTEVPP